MYTVFRKFGGLFSFAIVAVCLSTTAAAQRSIISADYGAGARRQNVTGRVQSMVQNGLLNFTVNNSALGGDPAPGQSKELRLRVREWNGRTQEMRFREGQNVYLQIRDYGNGGGWNPGGPGWGGGGGGQWGYHGVLAPEWQSKFDSYYSRWLEYQRRNDWGEIQSMERRMRDIMVNYRIPPNTPFEQVASPRLGNPGPGWGGGNWQSIRIVSARYGLGRQGRDVTQRLQGMTNNNGLSVRVNNDLFGFDPAPGRTKELWVDYIYQGRRRNVSVREGDNLRIP